MIAMPVDMQKVWNYYSRESILKAIVEVAKNREVVSVYRDGKFGKRPDIIQYPQDILQAIAEGAVSFHGSVERWQQPMSLDVGLKKTDLDRLRIGWDIFIDPDVDDFQIAKVVVKQIMEALKDHGVNSYSIKYSGGKGFHMAVPFESMPENINTQPTAAQYPEILQKIIHYLKWYMRDQLKEEIISLSPPAELSKKTGIPIEEIINIETFDPFKIVSMDIFSSRHLFRLPYSIHEKTMLVSVPIKPENIDRFEKEHALPEKVRVEEKFLVPRTKDTEALIIEALDWASKHMKEVEEQIPKLKVTKKVRYIPEESFPPCIREISKGLADGRKRSVFILINFLRNMGWSLEKIEEQLVKWSEKNYPPLRPNYLRTQLRWHFRQDRNLLPPNCDNEQFYLNMRVCLPDETCKAGTDKIVIKNPVNYPFRKMSKGQKKLKRK